MEHEPITVSIERRVNPARIAEATIWVQAGINLANKHPGFLGSGWIRSGEDSDLWYMLYRFSNEATLADWEQSSERAWWLSSGREFMEQSRVEKRTGIEGWFDAPDGILHLGGASGSGGSGGSGTGSTATHPATGSTRTHAHGTGHTNGTERGDAGPLGDAGGTLIDESADDPIPPAPPRWKQAVTIWLGFFPLNLVFTLIVTYLVPGWEPLGVLLHVLISTLILTPIMTYWLLPFVTRMLRPWLQKPRR